MRWGGELTSGTVKLMAIFLTRKKIGGFETNGERPSLEFLEFFNKRRRQRSRVGAVE